ETKLKETEDKLTEFKQKIQQHKEAALKLRGLASKRNQEISKLKSMLQQHNINTQESEAQIQKLQDSLSKKALEQKLRQQALAKLKKPTPAETAKPESKKRDAEQMEETTEQVPPAKKPKIQEKAEEQKEEKPAEEAVKPAEEDTEMAEKEESTKPTEPATKPAETVTEPE